MLFLFEGFNPHWGSSNFSSRVYHLLGYGFNPHWGSSNRGLETLLWQFRCFNPHWGSSNHGDDGYAYGMAKVSIPIGVLRIKIENLIKVNFYQFQSPLGFFESSRTLSALAMK